jgi:hypothetical protein
VPTWLIAPLIAAAVLFAAWWAETKATIMITELKAIREALHKLRADQSGKGGDNL